MSSHLTDLTGPIQRPVILVVDDDKVVHFIARRVLGDYPGTVIHAEDGEQAFSLAQIFHPDVVVTDALLPKLDGRELARRLKSAPETKACKVAVMSALYKGYRYRSEALTTFGADEYIEKPVTADKLRALVSGMLPVEFRKSWGGE